MRRRQVIAVVAVPAIAVAGCAGPDDLLETRPVGVPIVEVTVSEEAPQAATLRGDCRDDDKTIEPGETDAFIRESPDEACSVELMVGGEVAFEEDVRSNETYFLEVDAEGRVTEDYILY